MSKRKTTFYLSDETLKATKIAAARSGKHEYEVVEEALRAHLGLQLVDAVRSRNPLSSDEALELAYEELHAMRSDKQGT